MKTLTGLEEVATGLDGQPLVDPGGKSVVAKSLIANALARGQGNEPARAMSVAMQIYHCTNELQLDDADAELARQAVLADQVLTNLAKAAALKVFGD